MHKKKSWFAIQQTQALNKHQDTSRDTRRAPLSILKSSEPADLTQSEIPPTRWLGQPIPAPSPEAINAAALGALLIAASYGVLHHDIEALSSLPANVDRLHAASSMLQHLPAEWLEWYDHEALTFPLVTKASTSGVCYVLGDLCAQALSGKDLSTIRLDRAARSGVAGFVGHGPIAHYWLEFLDKFMSFGGAWWAVPAKIVADQGPMSIVYNTIYSLLIGVLALRDPREVLGDVKSAFVPGFLASIRFWPVVHLVTFGLIPIELQLLWIDVAEIVWVCILSQVNNEGIGHGDPVKDDSE